MCFCACDGPSSCLCVRLQCVSSCWFPQGKLPQCYPQTKALTPGLRNVNSGLWRSRPSLGADNAEHLSKRPNDLTCFCVSPPDSAPFFLGPSINRSHLSGIRLENGENIRLPNKNQINFVSDVLSEVVSSVLIGGLAYLTCAKWDSCMLVGLYYNSFDK